MTTLFLTTDELTELTERGSARYQIAWLESHGYPFERSALGKPRVLRAYVERRLGLASTASLSHTEPDFSAWKR